MSLSLEQVRGIAHLARLAVDEASIPEYAKDLSAILAFVEQIGKAASEGVEPMAHPLDAAQRLRPDEVTETDQRALFQSVAPATENGVYLVPRVIE